MSEQLAQFDHWVTIDDHHVLIKGGSDNEPSPLHHLNESGLHQKLMSGEAKPRQGDFVKAKLGTFAGFVKSEKTVVAGKKGSITGNMVAGPDGKETFLPHSEMQFVAPREYDSGVKFSPEFEHPNPKKARSTFSNGGETIGEEMEQIQLAEFDFKGDPEESDDYVIKYGKIFEAGKYDDKNFEITPEELKEAERDFTPVAIDVEHRPSLFDGKLGFLGSVSVGHNTKDLMGRLLFTKAAAELLKDVDIKVSTTWDAVKKRIVKIALTTDPRVPDAVVMARAATFNKEEVDEQFEHLTEFVGARHNANDLANLQNIHDTAASMGAVCTNDNQESNNHSESEKESTTMSEVTKPEANVATDASVALSSEVARLQAEIDKQNRQLVEMANRERRKDAVEFSGSQVKAGKITTATQEYLTAIFEQAARDDANPENKPAALVVFSGGKGKETKVVPMESRIATLQAFFNALPANKLDQEMVAGIVANPNAYTAQNLTALFDRGASNTDDPDAQAEADKKKFADKERLKGMTDLGKKAAKLAAK